MRDFFAILAIILAVVTLGIFQLPEENALISAGIKAEAEGLVYQAKHPLSVAVERSVITVSGRVESEAEAQAIIADLSKIDSVKNVRSDLRILPNATPFVFGIEKTPETISFHGHVEALEQVTELDALFGVESGLTVATGRPDTAWRGVAVRAAEVVKQLQSGRMDLVDHSLQITGDVLLPRDKATLEAQLADLPEGYSATVDITALDDGQPYRLRIMRDPLMGLRIWGKLPPDWDASDLETLGPINSLDIRKAPQPLYAPGFEEAVDLLLPLMQDTEFMADLVISNGYVSLAAGPLNADQLADIQSLAQRLPSHIGVDLALIPVDTGDGLHIELVWDGETLQAAGRVPADFDAPALSDRLGMPLTQTLTKSPYPDLSDWQSGVSTTARALAFLENGTLTYDGETTTLRGTALNPSKRRAAMAVLGTGVQSDIQLIDDGSPPSFELVYDPARGASVEGKLPHGLSPDAMAGAFGLSEIRARVRAAPQGQGDDVMAALSVLAPHMEFWDHIALSFDMDGIQLMAGAQPGIDLDQLAEVIAPMPNSVTFDLVSAPAPYSGTRRVHVVTGDAQIFAGGFWVPELPVQLNVDSCTIEAGLMPNIPFAPRSFALGLDAALPMNHLTALARACLDLAGLRLEIEGRANTASVDVLNPQLGRRRADAIRRELIARGFDGSHIRAKSGQAGAQESIAYRFSQP